MGLTIIPGGGSGGGGGSIASQACAGGVTDRAAVYRDGSGVLQLATINGTAAQARVVGLADSPSGGFCTLLLDGSTKSGFSGLTPGAPQYLHTTSGAITETKPSVPGGGYVLVGHAINSTTIQVKVQYFGSVAS